MPVTPLHFGPALLVREVVGKERFGIWAFTFTQVAFDAEPAIRMFMDIPGDLHQLHTPTFGVIYALLAIALLWRWERWAAVTGAVFGSASHLYLDSLYHADVAQIIAEYGIKEVGNLSPVNTEILCLLGFGGWLLIAGIRKSLQQRLTHVRNRSSGS